MKPFEASSADCDVDVADSRAVEPWPSGGLEAVPQCPVCRSGDRRLLYEQLSDRVFGCAPGLWRMFRCDGCAVAYLDPRPTRETLHLAYRAYYTHHGNRPAMPAGLGFVRIARRALANGYRNWRFGTALRPASTLGVWLAAVLPHGHPIIDREYRHLPALHGRLLDVGCGDGSFLRLAAAAGWSVMGLDPDPKAVEVAAKEGLDVRIGTIADLPGEQLFDWITMSHVIEHVHDPLATLKSARRLLKPGGSLWLETPNIASFGHRHYGANWRGLEPPRHLIVFNAEALASLLLEAGFTSVHRQCPPSLYATFAVGSEPSEPGPLRKLRVKLDGLKSRFLTALSADNDEVFILIAGEE